MKNNGLLLINKSEKITSNKIIQIIKKKFKIQKIGHCGTLDPQASGLLIVCIGNNTKISSKIINYKKKYIVIAIIGVKSITDDLDGKILFYEKNEKFLKNKKIKYTLKNIQNNANHKPHLFSSIKHNGIPIYKFARLDINIKIKKKENKIENAKLINKNKQTLMIKINCKHGVYIRSIINDLSEKIKIPICTLKIIRISIQNYTLLKAYTDTKFIRNLKIKKLPTK
jgi:tRNA pseudouridine55 synthase